MTVLRIVPGSANPALAQAVANHLGVETDGCTLQRFPDGELRPQVENACGADVYIVQPTSPPVNEHLVELLLLVDACRRSRAGRVTAVVPYFGYARQDRRTAPGQALGSAVVADAIAAAGADRLVVVDPHTPELEAVCRIPAETLSAVPALAGALAGHLPDGTVVVAPDLGAVKLAERYAAVLHGPVAVVRKQRGAGSAVAALDVAGDVIGRTAVIVDDMITTGATIEAAVGLLRAGAPHTTSSSPPRTGFSSMPRPGGFRTSACAACWSVTPWRSRTPEPRSRSRRWRRRLPTPSRVCTPTSRCVTRRSPRVRDPGLSRRLGP